MPKNKIQKFRTEEEKKIAQKEIVQKMDIYLPQLCIGYKLDLAEGKEILKNEIIVNIISDMYFSKQSDFFEKEYNSGKVNDSIDMQYEGSDSFSHVIISTLSTKIDEVEKDILEYIEKIKNMPVDDEMFNIIKKKKIGEAILSSDNLNVSYRRIIDSILNKTDVYYQIEVLKGITKEDIRNFLNKLTIDNQVSSKIISK